MSSSQQALTQPAPAPQAGSSRHVPRRRGRAAGPRRLRTAGRWAQVATATLLVAVCPVAVVWWLRADAIVSSAPLGVVIGIGLSMAVSQVGRLLWEQRPGSEDLLFSELMIWGYLHRCHTQRRLASAMAMVGPMGAAQDGDVSALGGRELARRLQRLVSGIETRDPYLHGHSRRVARHSWMIARRLGLSREEVARVRTAAAIHDVGKIHTPKAILHKPGALTDDEYEVIKLHPADGAQMAELLGDPVLTSMVRHHHERLDGTGYPDALRGEQIPLGARIIAVADTFDAITSARSYRSASPHKRAIDILREESGSRLDPAVVRAFCGHYAGRAPILLWSSLSGLPEQVPAWLGASVARVAAAAKVVAVAALVGGATVASSTLGLAAAKQPRARAHHHAITVTPAPGLDVRARRASMGSRTAPVPVARHAGAAHHASAGPRTVHGARPHASQPRAVSPAAGAAIGSGAAVPATGATGAGSSGEAGPGGEAPAGKGEAQPSRGHGEETAPGGKGHGEGPVTGHGEEAPGAVHGEAPPAASRGGEPPTAGRGEEPPAAAKGQQPPGKASTGEGSGAPAETAVRTPEASARGEEPHGSPSAPAGRI